MTSVDERWWGDVGPIQLFACHYYNCFILTKPLRPDAVVASKDSLLSTSYLKWLSDSQLIFHIRVSYVSTRDCLSTYTW